ncbi:MAG: T9SS type A sorting domain-containing protein [Bacteroidia bacterium]|nr:T9SS type A sorting domain-containing protein [Bacteroidia bacterium]
MTTHISRTVGVLLALMGALFAQTPGNTAASAIPITLTDNGDGTWTATVSGNTNASGVTDNFNPSTGATLGRASKDLFYTITLPVCLDSIKITTCSPNTNYDTYIHLINHTTHDTISNDDHGAPGQCSQSGNPSTPPSWLSTIIGVQGVNSSPIGPVDWLATPPVFVLMTLQRDTIRLADGDQLYIVVEGFNAASSGSFELKITGYRKKAPTLATTQVCPGSLVLLYLADSSQYPTGTTFQWTVDGNLMSGCTGASCTVNLSSYAIGSSVPVQIVASFPASGGCSPYSLTTNTNISIISPAAPVAGSIVCTACATPLLIGGSYQVALNPSAPPPSNGDVHLQISPAGANNWTTIATNPTFPYTVNIPLSAAAVGQYDLRLFVTPYSGCGASATASNIISLTIRDANGNRPANAIPITLSQSGSVWSAVVSGNTDTLGISNEYSNTSFGSPAADMFYTFTLPVCADSIRITTCSAGTDYDTRIHLLNQTEGDTIVNDDHNAMVPPCSASGGTPPIDPIYLSTIFAHGAIGSLTLGPIDWNSTPPLYRIFSFMRDTMPLRAGDEFLLIVEGFNAITKGKFSATITVYQRPRSSFLVNAQGPHPSGATVEVSEDSSITISVHAPSTGNTYTWQVYDGNTLLTSGSGSSISYTFQTVGSYIVRLLSDNGHCTIADTLTLTVRAPASIRSMKVGQFRVYPNPSAGEVTVMAPADGVYEIKVADISGKVLLVERMQGRSKQLRLNLPTGTYQLLISGEGYSGVVRLFIVE